MKALIYKELKLAMHPICYVFIVLFPFMILIPSYPLGIGFIYVLTCYPILFLGATLFNFVACPQKRYRHGENTHSYFHANRLYFGNDSPLSSGKDYQ